MTDSPSSNKRVSNERLASMIKFEKWHETHLALLELQQRRAAVEPSASRTLLIELQQRFATVVRNDFSLDDFFRHREKVIAQIDEALARAAQPPSTAPGRPQYTGTAENASSWKYAGEDCLPWGAAWERYAKDLERRALPTTAWQIPRQPEPRDGWIIDPAFLKRVKDEVCKVPEHYDLDMEHIEEVLVALEKVYSVPPPTGALRDALVHAVGVIQNWHNMDVPRKQRTELWDIYWRNAPEMKPIRNALTKGASGHQMQDCPGCDECTGPESVPDETNAARCGARCGPDEFCDRNKGHIGHCYGNPWSEPGTQS